MSNAKETEIKSLLEKGSGTLVRIGGVWSYPGAPLDPSGTNLRLPIEYVTDAQVQEALREGDFVAVTQDHSGNALSVRLLDGDDTRVALTTSQAGTPEAGTELPPNSRPSVDAGAKRMSGAEAEAAVAKNLAAVIPSREGAEAPGREPEAAKGRKEPAASTDARRGR